MNEVLPIDQFPDFFPVGDEHAYAGRGNLGVYADPNAEGPYGGNDGSDSDGTSNDGGSDYGSGGSPEGR